MPLFLRLLLGFIGYFFPNSKRQTRRKIIFEIGDLAKSDRGRHDRSHKHGFSTKLIYHHIDHRWDGLLGYPHSRVSGIFILSKHIGPHLEDIGWHLEHLVIDHVIPHVIH